MSVTTTAQIEIMYSRITQARAQTCCDRTACLVCNGLVKTSPSSERDCCAQSIALSKMGPETNRASYRSRSFPDEPEKRIYSSHRITCSVVPWQRFSLESSSLSPSAGCLTTATRFKCAQYEPAEYKDGSEANNYWTRVTSRRFKHSETQARQRTCRGVHGRQLGCNKNGSVSTAMRLHQTCWKLPKHRREVSQVVWFD